jgi:protoheme IX farnesyltransferase
VTPATGALPIMAGRRSARVVARSLFALTKPRIIELLLVTTIPTMLLAQRGLPSVKLLIFTLIGGAFAAGSANTFNCYIDRDIDALMKRTSRRPLARKEPLAVVKPTEALIFGVVLGAASTLLLGLLVNWLSAALADGAILFYVFVYTLGLKRRTASNIVIGGAAGCFPVLVGWSAVTGTVALPAVVLFAVIFFWTPPHFWALAMKFRDDYAAASVPMLPVVAPATVVARKILFYSYVMVAATLALAPYAGWLYTVSAAALGGWFLTEAHRLRARVQSIDASPDGTGPDGAGPDGAGPARVGTPLARLAMASSALVGGGHAASTGAASTGAASTGAVGTSTVGTSTVGTSAGGTSAVGAPGVPGVAAISAADASGVAEGVCAGVARPSANPAPMRLFHLSIAYLTLLFAAIAISSVLPWGGWEALLRLF